MRHLTVQQLSASLDGALVGVSLELVVRHLATCRECRDRHARLSKQDDTLRHLLGWDPGAQFFEDASIRIEAILDAESRGVAQARGAEIESQLPRETLDQLPGSVTVASQAPAPAIVPDSLPLAQPTSQLPQAPPPAPARRTIPRWATIIAASAATIALVLATLSALPPVIRIPAPELPRLPRLEWVRRSTPASAPTAITPVGDMPVDGLPLVAKAAVPAPAPTATPARTTTAAASVSTGAAPAADWTLLCGEVLDDNNTPVAGARVMLADLELSARTDKLGRFCIAAPAGDRTLSVVALGFAMARQVVSLGAQNLDVHVALKRSTIGE